METLDRQSNEMWCEILDYNITQLNEWNVINTLKRSERVWWYVLILPYLKNKNTIKYNVELMDWVMTTYKLV